MKKNLMVSSEVDGFAKVGGLADVVTGLSKSLVKLGHDVKIVMPLYKMIDRDKLKPLPGNNEMKVSMGNGDETCSVYTAPLPGGSNVQVYFIDHEEFFGKKNGIYQEPLFRPFAFFCRAAFCLCRKIQWYPDIIHAHDWPTAMVPVYLKFIERKSSEDFKNTKSILTIHNQGDSYQGRYDKSDAAYLKLDEEAFKNSGLEFGDTLNMLQAGLRSADKLTTVSPTYARETQTKELGYGLDGILTERFKNGDYKGILNGIDTEIWDPEKDPFIPKPYTVSTLEDGKAAAKASLQKIFGLPIDKEIPLIGIVTRLAEQKGINALFESNSGAVWPICKNMKIQMIVLGSGESWCENEIRSLTSQLGNFKAHIGYSDELAHLIEAGSDFFLMPSRYEPCGLNQIYSLRYASIPIVTNTGGLADTVEDFDLKKNSGTGFVIKVLSSPNISNTVARAIWAWYVRPDCIKEMRKRGMEKDFSWETSAKKYVEQYKEVYGNPDKR